MNSERILPTSNTDFSLVDSGYSMNKGSGEFTIQPFDLFNGLRMVTCCKADVDL